MTVLKGDWSKRARDRKAPASEGAGGSLIEGSRVGSRETVTSVNLRRAHARRQSAEAAETGRPHTVAIFFDVPLFTHSPTTPYRAHAIVVLGRGLNPDGSLPPLARQRVD